VVARDEGVEDYRLTRTERSQLDPRHVAMRALGRKRYGGAATAPHVLHEDRPRSAEPMPAAMTDDELVSGCAHQTLVEDVSRIVSLVLPDDANDRSTGAGTIQMLPPFARKVCPRVTWLKRLFVSRTAT